MPDVLQVFQAERQSHLFREVNTIAAHVIYIQIFTQSL